MACGDRLEVERRVLGSTVAYAHQGIDVGDGTVVHARPDDFRDPLGGGRVVRTGLDEFAAGAIVGAALWLADSTVVPAAARAVTGAGRGQR